MLLQVCIKIEKISNSNNSYNIITHLQHNHTHLQYNYTHGNLYF